MVRFLRSFLSPSSLCRRLLSTSTAVLGAAVLQLNFPLEAFFIAWCSPVVACFLRLPYAKRRLGAAVLQVQFFFFILLFSSFIPFRRYAPSSPYFSHQAWDLKRGCFFFCRIPYAVPCCFNLLYVLRYKRYIFFRPGFEGFLPNPPRLAAILAWLSSYIVRSHYLCPF